MGWILLQDFVFGVVFDVNALMFWCRPFCLLGLCVRVWRFLGVDFVVSRDLDHKVAEVKTWKSP